MAELEEEAATLQEAIEMESEEETIEPIDLDAKEKSSKEADRRFSFTKSRSSCSVATKLVE